DLKYWAPQMIGDDVKASQGRLEIFASAVDVPKTGQGKAQNFLSTADGTNLLTFSTAAAQAAKADPRSQQDPATAAVQYSDGVYTVLFDQAGVGLAPATTWTTVAGMIMPPPPAGDHYHRVAWSVGQYSVDAKTIYALICAPATGGPYPVVVYNHGGIQEVNDS